MSEYQRPYEAPSNWAWVKIEDVADVLRGKNLSKGQYNESGAGLPYIIGASNMKNGVLEIARWSEIDRSKVVLSRTNDILVSCVGTLGKIAVNNIGDAILSKHVIAIRPKNERVLPEFLLMVLLARIGFAIPEDTESKTGFSNTLEPVLIRELEFAMPDPRTQKETTDALTGMINALPFGYVKPSEVVEIGDESPLEFARECISQILKEERGIKKCLAQIEKLLGESEASETEINQMELNI